MIKIQEVTLFDNYKVPDHSTQGELLKKGRTYNNYTVLYDLLKEALNPENVRNPRYRLQTGGELPNRSIIDTTRRGLQVCLFRWIDL